MYQFIIITRTSRHDVITSSRDRMELLNPNKK
nr:MAG TPA: hypothetical protein [Caudoviricetes sp.]